MKKGFSSFLFLTFVKNNSISSTENFDKIIFLQQISHIF